MAVNKCFCCGRSLPPPWRLARLHLPPFPPLLVGSHSTCDPPFACRSSPSCPKVQRSQKKDLVCAYGEGSQTATLGHIRKKNEESWMATMPNRLVAKWFPDEGRESWVCLEFFNCSSSHFWIELFLLSLCSRLIFIIAGACPLVGSVRNTYHTRYYTLFMNAPHPPVRSYRRTSSALVPPSSSSPPSSLNSTMSPIWRPRKAASHPTVGVQPSIDMSAYRKIDEIQSITTPDCYYYFSDTSNPDKLSSPSIPISFFLY